MVEESTNSSEYRSFPGNQEQYYGQLIPRSNSDRLQSPLDSTGFDLTMPCTNCEEFHEIRRDAFQLRMKSCITCSKEYAYCFCNEICHKVTPGQRTEFKYEYLTCDKGECDYLGVRCTNCRKLCKILVSKDEKLFWCCKSNNNQCHFFKQHVVTSLRNHIESCKNILSINADILCKLILRYVDNLDFINVLNKFYNIGKLDNLALNEIKSYLNDRSPEIVNVIENEILKVFSPTTPNRYINQNEFNNILNLQGISPTPVVKNNVAELPNKDNNMDIEELNQNFNIFKDEIQENFKKFENELKSQNEKSFNNLEDELKSQNEINFNKLEDELKSRTEENLNNLRNELQELKHQTQENHECLENIFEENSKIIKTDIENNFSTLFEELKIKRKLEVDSDEDKPSNRKSKRIENKKKPRGGSRRGGRGKR